MKRFILAASILALAGCASNQNQIVAGIESGYIAAESAELVYEQSGHATAPIIKQAETYRLQAQAAIAPLLAAAEAGGSVATAAEIEAAQAALSQLTAYLTTNGITPATGAAQ